MKNIRRKIGFIALAISLTSAIIAIFLCESFSFSAREITPFMLVYGFGGMIAFVCLIGDVIRFIGKCFSQGFNGTQSRGNGRFCTNCGKAIDANAKFCSHYGSKQDTNI